MGLSDDDRHEAVVAMIKYMVDKNRLTYLAKVFLRLQDEYLEIATLATDGEFDSEQWTHKNLMDFLTKGKL